jgi:hypothetical protein
MSAALRLTPQDASLDRVEWLTQHATKMLRARKLDAVSFALESAQAIVDRMRRERHVTIDPTRLTRCWLATSTSLQHDWALVDGEPTTAKCGLYRKHGSCWLQRPDRKKCRRCK